MQQIEALPGREMSLMDVFGLALYDDVFVDGRLVYARHETWRPQFTCVGRLAPDVSAEAAEAEIGEAYNQ